MTKDEYRSYLKTPHWQSKRQEAIKHHGDKCYVCGSTYHINVHHKTYNRKTSGLYNERMGDLCILCGTCHRLSHQFRRRPMKKKQLRRAKAIVLLGHSKEVAFMHCADSQFSKWRISHGLPASVNEWGVFDKPRATKKSPKISEFIQQHHYDLRHRRTLPAA